MKIMVPPYSRMTGDVKAAGRFQTKPAVALGLDPRAEAGSGEENASNGSSEPGDAAVQIVLVGTFDLRTDDFADA